MPTTHTKVPPIGREEPAAPAADPSIPVGIWKSLVMTEAGSKHEVASKSPAFAITWLRAFHPRRWWRLWRDDGRS